MDDYVAWADSVTKTFSRQYYPTIRRTPKSSVNSSDRSGTTAESSASAVLLVSDIAADATALANHSDKGNSADGIASLWPEVNFSSVDEPDPFPACFYAQMVAGLDTHRSVSCPATPRARSLEMDDAAHALKIRLDRWGRRVRSQAAQEGLSLQLFDGVEVRATQCAKELQEMIAYLRQLNQATADAKRQLLVSKSIDVPR